MDTGVMMGGETQPSSPRRVMICRKVVGADGVARVVLEPASPGVATPQYDAATAGAAAQSLAASGATDSHLPSRHHQQLLHGDADDEDDDYDEEEQGGGDGEDGDHYEDHHADNGLMQVNSIASHQSSTDDMITKHPKPFIQCEICGKKFYVTDTTYKRTPKERLTLHIITDHDKERLYQCPYEGCFKAYNNIKLLNQHKLVHTGQKNHKCPQCPKGFHRKTHLLAHMRRHKSNPNFKPRASRRQCNPYIQEQHKRDKSGLSLDDDRNSISKQVVMVSSRTATRASGVSVAKKTLPVTSATIAATRSSIRTRSAAAAAAAAAGITTLEETAALTTTTTAMTTTPITAPTILIDSAYRIVQGNINNAGDRSAPGEIMLVVSDELLDEIHEDAQLEGGLEGGEEVSLGYAEVDEGCSEGDAKKT